MNRVTVKLIAGAVVLCSPAAASAATLHVSQSSTEPEVVNAVLTHRASPDQAPYTVIFATDRKLTRTKDSDNIFRYPGDVLVNGGRRLNGVGSSPGDVPAGHRRGEGRYCYAANGLYRNGNLRLGRRYSVRITLSNNKNAPSTTFRRKLKTRTVIDATKALGC